VGGLDLALIGAVLVHWYTYVVTHDCLEVYIIFMVLYYDNHFILHLSKNWVAIVDSGLKLQV
jgi:hypothetical protein